MGAARYKAFISYSHRDERWARWLHRALENYRIPSRLVGQEGQFGKIPSRLRPVFRDRVDLSSAADLHDQILGELRESETLIVICSPAAAASHWVNEEIREYRRMGRGNRILALVVDGDPLAEDPSEACFPPALLESEDGKGHHEPLAADARRYADGKHLSLLKIIAGMLGIRLDRLRQRDAHRRLRRRIVQGLALLILAAVIASLGWKVETERQEARLQRSNTEELLQYMLGELDELAPIVGLEQMDPDDDRQAQIAVELGLARFDDEALLGKSNEWRRQGLDLQWAGDLAGAMSAFTRSRAALVELHQREGNTPRVLFELGQAEFYVGAVHLDMGEVEIAEQHFSQYGALTRRLLNSDPKNPVYVMELSYTIANLGALEQYKAVPDIERSLELLQTGVRYTQMALLLDPGNQDYREAQITQLSYLADAWLEKCALGNALEVRQQTAQLRKDLVDENPGNSYMKQELAFSLNGLAGVQQMIGLNTFSRFNFEDAVVLLDELHGEEPGNGKIEWELLYRSNRLARLLSSTGHPDEAAEIIYRIAPRIAELSVSEITREKYAAIEAARFRLDHGLLLLRDGRTSEGRAQLKAALEGITKQIRATPDFKPALAELARATFEYWRVFGEAPGGLAAEQLERFYRNGGDSLSCQKTDLVARLAIMQDEQERAAELTAYLLGRGYFEADFINFCRVYGLCNQQ
jgi:hypothetical protein